MTAVAFQLMVSSAAKPQILISSMDHLRIGVDSSNGKGITRSNTTLRIQPVQGDSCHYFHYLNGFRTKLQDPPRQDRLYSTFVALPPTLKDSSHCYVRATEPVAVQMWDARFLQSRPKRSPGSSVVRFVVIETTP